MYQKCSYFKEISKRPAPRQWHLSAWRKEFLCSMSTVGSKYLIQVFFLNWNNVESERAIWYDLLIWKRCVTERSLRPPTTLRIISCSLSLRRFQIFQCGSIKPWEPSREPPHFDPDHKKILSSKTFLQSRFSTVQIECGQRIFATSTGPNLEISPGDQSSIYLPICSSESVAAAELRLRELVNSQRFCVYAAAKQSSARRRKSVHKVSFLPIPLKTS